MDGGPQIWEVSFFNVFGSFGHRTPFILKNSFNHQYNHSQFRSLFSNHPLYGTVCLSGVQRKKDFIEEILLGRRVSVQHLGDVVLGTRYFQTCTSYFLGFGI